jgi:hypothetical protein
MILTQSIKPSEKGIMKQKILDLIATLDETNYQASLDWYFILHDYAANLAERTNLPLFQVAGIISALSPMVMFTTNLRDAERFCSTRSIANLATYRSQRLKALMILGARNENEVLKILNGNKTKAFYLNILKPETSMDVCLDSWMQRVFEIKNYTPKRYREASETIAEIAQELNLKPHQVQALAWVGMRGKAF